MRLTDRDIDILRKINECSWLSTKQIKRCFFETTTKRAVNKRLRLLVDAGYLFCDRNSSTEEYFFRLGVKARQILEEHGLESDGIYIPRTLPVQLKHFSTINDLRWYAEQAIQKKNGILDFFFVDRELKGMLGNSLVIPDALLSFTLGQGSMMKRNVVALEYDAATENPQYFGRDKVRKYVLEFVNRNGVFATENLRVLVFADSRKRIVQLIKHSMKFLDKQVKFLFGSLEDLEQYGDLFATIFIDPTKSEVRSGMHLISLLD